MSVKRGPRPGGQATRRGGTPAVILDALSRRHLPPTGSIVRMRRGEHALIGELTAYELVDERIVLILARAERDSAGNVRAIRRVVRLDSVDIVSWDVEPTAHDAALVDRLARHRTAAAATEDDALADAGEIAPALLAAVLALAVFVLGLALVGASLAEQRVDGRVLLGGILAAASLPPVSRLLQRACAWVDYGRPGPWW